MASFPVDCKECHVVDYFVAVDVLLSKNANGDVLFFIQPEDMQICIYEIFLVKLQEYGWTICTPSLDSSICNLSTLIRDLSDKGGGAMI